MNEFIENLDSIRSRTGLDDPIKINQTEKNEFQLNLDILKNREIQDKVKENKPISYSEMSWGRTIESGLQNLPKDILPFYKDYIAGMYETLRHPISTGEALKDVGIGMLKTGILKQYDAMLQSAGFKKDYPKDSLSDPSLLDKDKMDKQIKMWIGVEKEFYNNFGTEEGFKKFIATNPTEALMTLAEIMIPVSKTFKLKGLARFASAIDPINLIAESLTPITKVIKKLPISLHTKALKLTDSMPMSRMDKLIDISVKNKLGMNIESITKLQDQLTEIKNVKDKVIVNLGGKVDIKNTFRGLDKYVTDMLAVSSEGIEIKDTVDKIKKSILKAEKELKRKDLTLSELDLRKQRWNKELDGYYEKVSAATESMPIRKEIKSIVNKAQKEILQEMVPSTSLLEFPKLSKRIIQKAFPYVKEISLEQINDIQGSLIELRRALEGGVKDLRVKPFFDFQVGQRAATGSFAGVLSGGAVGTLFGDTLAGSKIGGVVGGGAGLLIGMIDSNPRIKMAVGRYINSLNKVGIITQPSAVLIRMGLQEAGDYAIETQEGTQAGKLTMTK